MLAIPLAVVDCAVLATLFFWFRRLQQGSRTGKVPPGPKGYPIIGNMLDMMVSEIWEVARKWRNIYGDLIYMTNLGQSVLVINSYDIACELLEKRSLNYSDRPHAVMLNELQGWDWGFTMKNYGDDWRRLRAPMQKFFEPANLVQFENILHLEAEKLLRGLLRSPKQYEIQIRTAIASSIMTLIYGHEVTSTEDPFVALARDGVNEITLAMRPGTYLVDVIPMLKYIPKWFPGAAFHAAAENGARLSRDVRYLPFLNARDKILSGTTTVRSLTAQEVENCRGIDGKLSEADQDRISAIGGVGYLAGADTSVSALMTLLLAITLFPEVQRRAQIEIDQSVGTDRLPTLSDRVRLPYCAAICKEIQRWNPIIPCGLAHVTREDDTYNGYFIPAKSIIMPNQWAMLYDPEEYPDPNVFRPERFFPKKGERMQRDPAKIAFGFGRRICPGRFLAEDTIFVMTTRILSVFNISKSLDGNGKVIEPDIKFSLDGVVRHPHQFECTIKPRSREAEELIPLE